MAQNTSIPISVPPMGLGPLVLYFLKLGTIGFGGPAALVGYMRKDLVDEGKCLDESTYNLSIALAQIMPGPLAAQTAIAIGYFQGGYSAPHWSGSPSLCRPSSWCSSCPGCT